MSLVNIKPFLRTRIESLNAGFREWKDAFNFENAPSTVLNKSYHLSFPITNGEPQSNRGQFIVTNVELKFVVKAYKDTSAGYDEALRLAERIITTVMDQVDRPVTIKTINFQSMSLEPKSFSNDNDILVTQAYELRTALCYA